MSLSTEELSKLIEGLPSTGAPKLIQQKLKKKKCNASLVHIRNNLKGEYFNIEIIEAAMEVRDEHMKRVKSVKQKLES